MNKKCIPGFKFKISIYFYTLHLQTETVVNVLFRLTMDVTITGYMWFCAPAVKTAGRYRNSIIIIQSICTFILNKSIIITVHD